MSNSSVAAALAAYSGALRGHAAAVADYALHVEGAGRKHHGNERWLGQLRRVEDLKGAPLPALPAPPTPMQLYDCLDAIESRAYDLLELGEFFTERKLQQETALGLTKTAVDMMMAAAAAVAAAAAAQRAAREGLRTAAEAAALTLKDSAPLAPFEPPQPPRSALSISVLVATLAQRRGLAELEAAKDIALGIPPDTREAAASAAAGSVAEAFCAAAGLRQVPASPADHDWAEAGAPDISYDLGRLVDRRVAELFGPVPAARAGLSYTQVARLNAIADAGAGEEAGAGLARPAAPPPREALFDEAAAAEPAKTGGASQLEPLVRGPVRLRTGAPLAYEVSLPVAHGAPADAEWAPRGGPRPRVAAYFRLLAPAKPWGENLAAQFAASDRPTPINVDKLTEALGLAEEALPDGTPKQRAEEALYNLYKERVESLRRRWSSMYSDSGRYLAACRAAEAAAVAGARAQAGRLAAELAAAKGAPAARAAAAIESMARDAPIASLPQDFVLFLASLG
jgi:hypothetical protein